MDMVKRMPKPGEKVHIYCMEGEPHYAGREGIVKSIDSLGQIHGTWGGCALWDSDDFVVLEE